MECEASLSDVICSSRVDDQLRRTLGSNVQNDTCELSVQGDEMGSPDGFTYSFERRLEVFPGDVHGVGPVGRGWVGGQ